MVNIRYFWNTKQFNKLYVNNFYLNFVCKIFEENSIRKLQLVIKKMSGGDRKKRACDRGQGWEEAGAEFYQESYPAAIEADLQQALQRDPSHIATLLPSKKSRVGKFVNNRIYIVCLIF